ncbi:hypothetical protein FJ872_30005 [Mesorhizobium sp. B2-5-9]|uniref:hypothetical protein n=1 Tax=Mesorhizobium sp. B2-5-9 TaxID=2589921 RepID=UPI00112D3B24|nr:hypothetical protein [Mesorhizobium sp. B2-5-9]TPK00958.1 hypothetical protein FJ872_30005 [Mesorhizobium sp. B2-5-9]
MSILIRSHPQLDSIITQQATLISYLDDFKFQMLLSLAAMPLVILLKKGRAFVPDDHSLAIE